MLSMVAADLFLLFLYRQHTFKVGDVPELSAGTHISCSILLSSTHPPNHSTYQRHMARVNGHQLKLICLDPYICVDTSLGQSLFVKEFDFILQLHRQYMAFCGLIKLTPC
jgi:hypothetical protein